MLPVGPPGVVRLSVSTPLTEFAAGHVFAPVVFDVDAERLRGYTAAVADAVPFYESEGLAPPLALVAFSLGGLLEQVSLPAGSLHVNESMESHRAVRLGERLECRFVLAQRSQRAGWIVSVIDVQIGNDMAPALTARATLLSPLTAA